MTDAILSFATPGRVVLQCDDAAIVEERRDLEPQPPFELWSRMYATGEWSADVLAALGLAMSRWLDGPQHWLTKLANASPPLILTIEVGSEPDAIGIAALDAPWELLAHIASVSNQPSSSISDSNAMRNIGPSVPGEVAGLLAQLSRDELHRVSYLALEPGLLLTCVRRLGPARADPRPSPYRLSMVFMAAQPDGLAGLAVDQEEVAIQRAAGGIGIDLAIEDSGSLLRLAELVAQTAGCDVIHISCHGDIAAQPILALEGELGQRVDATAQDLSLAIGKKPPLAFLSACSSASADRALWSLSSDLCRRGWPAVIGWSCSVTDAGAIDLAAALYRQLVLRQPVAAAFAQARAAFATMPRGAEWHKARLFVRTSGGGSLVDGTRTRPAWPGVLRAHAYLDTRTRTIPVAPSEQAFPHRRALQRVLAALRGSARSGVVIHGGTELGRATVAGRALDRLERDLPRVVVARDFDAASVLNSIRAHTANADVDEIVSRFRTGAGASPGQLLQALREILERPCQNPGAGAFALVLHGFDPVVVPNSTPGARSGLAARHLFVARAIVGAFAGARTASRVLFTSATTFSVIADDGGDIADTLHFESLAG